MTKAIDKIRAEHRELARVLGCLAGAIADLRDIGRRPDLELLYSILYYIRVFPDRYHHPKEERYLFEALARRDPSARPLIDRLRQQHQEGDRLIDRLAAALRDHERHFPAGYEALAEAAETYLEFQAGHMQTEETELLPLAEAKLTAEDWGVINNAFAQNSDPLFAENLEAGFLALRERIVHGTEALHARV